MNTFSPVYASKNYSMTFLIKIGDVKNDKSLFTAKRVVLEETIITGSFHTRLDQKNAKMEVTSSDFFQIWHICCPIWENENSKFWGSYDLQGPHTGPSKFWPRGCMVWLWEAVTFLFLEISSKFQRVPVRNAQAYIFCWNHFLIRWFFRGRFLASVFWPRFSRGSSFSIFLLF